MKREQIRTVIAGSHRGQISWVSGSVGGGQGTERRKDNLEPLIKQANIIYFILTVAKIIVTVLPPSLGRADIPTTRKTNS